MTPGAALMLADMSDAELEAHIVAAMDERARRRVLADAPRKAKELTQQVMDAEGVTEGEPWRPLVLGYPKGWVTVRDERTYTSMIDNNVWMPGDPNDPQTGRWWREEVPEADPRAWAPWTDYAAGEECTFDGESYTAIQSHHSQPGWEPPNTPALWEKSQPLE